MACLPESKTAVAARIQDPLNSTMLPVANDMQVAAKDSNHKTAERLFPSDPVRMRRFLDTFLYDEAAFMVDEILEMNEETSTIHLDTDRWDLLLRFGLGIDAYITEHCLLNAELAPSVRFADYGNIPSTSTDHVSLTFTGGIQYRC
jgi:hypothetical protein